jgi:ABC-2 type transport system permease protein
MWRRELAIAFGARVTWIAAAIAALVVGHGFVLAVDLYSAASRAALANTLMRKELDPLSGVVRPMLGGCQLAVALLVPVIAARLLAVEKERNTFGAAALAAGSPGRVALRRVVSAFAAASLVLLGPIVLAVLFVIVGGHLDGPELVVAFTGHLLHVAFVATASVAAAAWTRTVAQATTLAILVSLASWAIEAGEGFAALAWLGPLEAVAVSRQLAPFESGIIHVGALLWFALTIGGAGGTAWLGARFDLRQRTRTLAGVALALVLAGGVALSTHVHRAHDWTELARASLPPAAVAELRGVPDPIEIEMWLDREDSRRKQLERDALAKLRLARSDIRITTPLDDLGGGAVTHDEQYGRIVIRVGGRVRETRSTSRRELVTLIFEALGRPLPDWSQPAYPGYPLVVDGWRSSLIRVIAYLGLPGLFLSIGWLSSRRRRRR